MNIVIAFLVSCAVLLLQLLQTRIYSVVFWNHFVYFIITIALMGFGISGTWLALDRSHRLARVLTARRAALAFIPCAAFSCLVASRVAIGMGALVQSPTTLLQLLVVYAPAVLPYFFAGWILGLVFRSQPARIGLLYFADLVGAALGCAVFVTCLRPTGAAGLLVIVLLLVGAVTCLPPRRDWRGLLAVVGIIGLCAGILLARKPLEASIQPEASKLFTAWYRDLPDGDQKKWEFTEWNPMSRIDVVSTEKKPDWKNIFIDGDAWTEMVVSPPAVPPPFRPDQEPMFNRQSVYLLGQQPRSVLVIGSGGGKDVWCALRAGASHVDAVEVNPTTARIGREEYAKTNGMLFRRPQVTLVNAEGRSFVKRTNTQYDTIVMHGIDTFTASSSGAYVLTENYLYTLEAMKDYLSRLTPEGTLSIARWEAPAEALRLFATALDGLRAIGIGDPIGHVLALNDPELGLATVLIRLRPFTAVETGIFYEHARKYDFRGFFARDRSFGQIGATFSAYANAFRENREVAYRAGLPYDISPVTDDSPFFFYFERIEHLFHMRGNTDQFNLIFGNWPTLTLLALGALGSLALLIFIFLPLWRGAGRASAAGALSPWLSYFAAIGIAFILVEIVLLQRFALLLGHPSRSLTCVLGGLLLSAGIGSYASSRFNLRPIHVAPLLCGLLAVVAFGYPKVVDLALPLSLPTRVVLCLALVALPGIPMGMFFPYGIRKVGAQDASLVPWMWGVNGGATVLGSILSAVLAMVVGFTHVLLLAIAGYLAAWMALHMAERRDSAHHSD